MNCSNIQLKTLLKDKKVITFQVLERFLDSEMPVYEDDLYFAIHTLSSDDFKTFKLIVSRCMDFNAKLLCKKAFSCNKVAFVSYFNELQATTSGNNVKLFNETLKKKDFDSARTLVSFFSKEVLESLNLGELLKTTNLITNTELIKLLLEKGVSYDDKTPPILSVMSEQTLNDKEKIEVICILIEGGVDCKQLCKISHKNTTPLHIATDLALSSKLSYGLI